MDSQDLLLHETGNGGDLEIISNDLALTEQLYQQIYLCLFGGNVEADTRGDELATESRLDWWGNSAFFSQNKGKQFNSQTERALNENALNSTGRVNIARAVEADLSYFKSITDITVNVVILSYNKVMITITMNQPSNQQGKILQIIWDNAKKELITDKDI